MLEKMIINSARQAMLENITALDKKTLQRELESHLKLEFKYKDEKDRLTNNWNELEEWLESYISLIDNPDTFEEQTLEDLKEVLDKMKEIKDGNNDPN